MMRMMVMMRTMKMMTMMRTMMRIVPVHLPGLVDEGEGEADVAVHGPARPQVRGEAQAQQARLDSSDDSRDILPALGCFLPGHS